MGDTAEGKGPGPDPDRPVQAPPLQHQGGTVDDHGRAPGTASRVGTGSTEPSIDPDRVRQANTVDRMPRRYELTFPGVPEGGRDTVEVSVTGRTGPGGHPVYEDATGIIQAEISDKSEVRVLATGAGQEPAPGVTARPLAG